MSEPIAVCWCKDPSRRNRRSIVNSLRERASRSIIRRTLLSLSSLSARYLWLGKQKPCRVRCLSRVAPSKQSLAFPARSPAQRRALRTLMPLSRGTALFR